MHTLTRLTFLLALLLAGTAAQSATFTVTNNANTGAGSLRQALADAAAALSGATITQATEFAIADVGGVTLDASALAAPVVIAASHTGGTHRHITHTAGSLTLRRLRLTGGNADATNPNGPGFGGSVRSTGGTFAAFDCTFDANQATGSGGALTLDSALIVTWRTHEVPLA